MLRNHLKIAYRNLLKNKVFSLINILGLAVGMAACLLILRYVVFELSYDTFHQDGDRLYRVALQSSLFGSATDVSVANHPAVGRTLLADFPEVTRYTRLFPIDIWMETVAVQVPGEADTYIEDQVYVADTSFLTLFSFPLLAGDPATVLREPNALVLTASTARKYFGTTEGVVGRSLYVNGDNEVMPVTGVLADSARKHSPAVRYASIGRDDGGLRQRLRRTSTTGSGPSTTPTCNWRRALPPPTLRPSFRPSLPSTWELSKRSTTSRPASSCNP